MRVIDGLHESLGFFPRPVGIAARIHTSLYSITPDATPFARIEPPLTNSALGEGFSHHLNLILLAPEGFQLLVDLLSHGVLAQGAVP